MPYINIYRYPISIFIDYTLIYLYPAYFSALPPLLQPTLDSCLTCHTRACSSAAAAPAPTGMSLCQRSLHCCKRQETRRGGKGREEEIAQTDATTDKHVASFGTEQQARSVNDRGAPYLPRCLLHSSSSCSRCQLSATTPLH